MWLGRLDEAEHVAQTAIDRLESLDVHPPRWRFYLLLGKVHLAAGRRVEAERALCAAQEAAGRIADSIPDEALRNTFLNRAMALFPTRRPLTAPQVVKQTYSGLTRRECQVAAQVALGQSNREIAETLVVSLKTVEAHISRILSKLGFTSRAQIAVWAVEKGLVSAPQDPDRH
jgi:DNA-binding NarL/FixJ family response regulator